TQSTNFPTTLGSFQPVLSAGSDAFVAKLNPAGSALVYSTYIGGSAFDTGYGIALDAADNAYVISSTTSPNFPTINAPQSCFVGGTCVTITPLPCADAFVTKLNAAGSALVYSTYLGGNQSDAGHGIAVDTSGNAYVIGDTASVNFPTTPGSFQAALEGY